MKKFVVLYIIVFIIVIVLPIGYLFYKVNEPIVNYDYHLAKKETILFLNENELELEKVCIDALLKKDSKTDIFKEKRYSYETKIYYIGEEKAKEYIKIDINAQGMLGGQYWSLIYSEGDYLDGKKIIIDDEFQKTGNGDNVFIKEHLRDNWYFEYEDWDGHVDIENIEK